MPLWHIIIRNWEVQAMTNNSPGERLYNGLIKENPTFVMMLGMCPTLAVTTAAINGVGMGLCTTAVLVLSNLLISALRKIIPDSVRMPAFIVVVASLVTVVEFLMKGFLPDLSDSLGVYIPLIVVNCIILGRAEAYASKNPIIPSIFDGLGMGLGFTFGLVSISIVRELIGKGTIFGLSIMPSGYTPISIFVLQPGAFLVLAFLVALLNKIRKGKGKAPLTIGCSPEDCAHCGNHCCGGRAISEKTTTVSATGEEGGQPA